MIRQNHGFTIIEVMIVVAIVGVTMAIGVPAMRDFVMNSRMSASVNDVAISFNLARGEAIKRGQNVTIARNAGARGWAEGWAVTATDASATVLQRVDEMESTTTLVSTGLVATFNYNSTGRSSASPGTLVFDLCDDRDSETGRTITVGVTGRVSTVTKDNCDP